MLAGMVQPEEKHLRLSLIDRDVVADLGCPELASLIRLPDGEIADEVGVCRSDGLDLSHHLSVVVVSGVGRWEIQRLDELLNEEAELGNLARLLPRRADDDILGPDLDDVRAGARDGCALLLAGYTVHEVSAQLIGLLPGPRTL